LISEIIKSFKKELYSSIAKRMKRSEKKSAKRKDNIPEQLKQWSGSSCKLDELKKRKQD
jgi:hypothetical protein